MLSRSFLLLITIALAGCPGSAGDIGDPCANNGACDNALQCVANVCVPRCQRAPECGDGYACTSDGLCVLASGENGDACHSEVDCAPGLSCQINNGTSVDDNKRLLASCTTQNSSSKPPNAECTIDSECRNGTCALGRCVDLCTETRDCNAGTTCMTTPRVAAPSNGQLFDACLPSSGNIVWSIPTSSVETEILLPVPSGARSATVVFRVDDTSQLVGARTVWSPSDEVDDPSYAKPCVVQGPMDARCNSTKSVEEFFANRLRHLPEPGQSVLQIPSSTTAKLEPGAYRIATSSFRTNGLVGSAIPRVTAILKKDTAVNLDLRFHFLDLADHPCQDSFGGVLDAMRAQEAPFFQTTFLGELRTIFAGAGVALGNLSYSDRRDHPDLDALSVDDAPALFSLGTNPRGIDIYFVRSISPVGLQAIAPNPGPGGLAGSRQSGIAIGVDTLCYRSWGQFARLTAHEVARYMGLYHNVELEVQEHPNWRDGIADTDPEPGRETTNLMFFSEFGGTEVTAGQREILTKSAVLR